MARLMVRSALVLMAVCGAAVLLALLVPGRGVPRPGASTALGFGACAPPCWAGIVVGQTPLAAVGARFDANIAAPRKGIDFTATGAVYWGVTESAELKPSRSAAFSGNLLAQAGASEVTYIHLNLDVPLWYLLLTLGDPAYVEVHQPFPDYDHLEMALYWSLPGASAAATLNAPEAGQFTLHSAISSLTFAMAGDDGVYGRALRPYHRLGRVPWQGFVPFTQYQADAEALAAGQI
jgi:hypothetical protein